MQLNQFIKAEFINVRLLAKSKDEVLVELIDMIIRGGLKINRYSVFNILKRRENLGSTGIGDGVAIPHGKIPDLDNIMVAFGRSEGGIVYDSIDGKPAHLFFLLLAPENSEGQHLKILALISKMLKDNRLREKLLRVESPTDLYKIIIEQGNEG